ncbi:hypothetical protein ACHAWF_019039 [Thalassiosira exigua]
MTSLPLPFFALFALFAAGKCALVSAATADGGVIWSSTGGGWRAMAAGSAYAQVFSRLGLLGTNGTDATTAAARPKIDVVATTSGSSWFSAQFFFSDEYYSAVADGTATSLGDFTRRWLEAYASTQANLTVSCDGPFEDICTKLDSEDPFKSDLYLMSLASAFNYSWPNIVFAMFEATSKEFDDEDMVDVKASFEQKLPVLDGIDVCFHTSLLPNARARGSNTITYLAKDVDDPNTTYTVPLPYDWCVGDQDSEWHTPLPGGNVYYPSPEQFVGSPAYRGFPVYPLKQADAALYVTPEMNNLTSSITPQNMDAPFGGMPTAVQISTASSSTMGYVSEELPSYFAQYMSVVEAEIKESQSFTEVEKLGIVGLLNEAQEDLWTTGLLSNAATCSVWTEASPLNMPAGKETSYWFTDGGYTDGPAAATAIARYQKMHGTDGEIKLIITNMNYYTNTMNNILAYFSTTWNQKVGPGEFIWPIGVGENDGPQNNPQQSNQIFQESLDKESLNALLEPIGGTNLTMASLSATTLDNGA